MNGPCVIVMEQNEANSERSQAVILNKLVAHVDGGGGTECAALVIRLMSFHSFYFGDVPLAHLCTGGGAERVALVPLHQLHLLEHLDELLTPQAMTHD